MLPEIVSVIAGLIASVGNLGDLSTTSGEWPSFFTC